MSNSMLAYLCLGLSKKKKKCLVRYLVFPFFDRRYSDFLGHNTPKVFFVRKNYLVWNLFSFSLPAFSFSCFSSLWVNTSLHQHWVLMGITCVVLGVILLLLASNFCLTYVVSCRINGKHWFTQQKSPHNKEGVSLFPKSSWTESWLPMLTGLSIKLNHM